METFSALLAICAGNAPVTGELPTQRAVTRSFDVFFDLRPNERLSKQSWGWWFETSSRPLWRHCNTMTGFAIHRPVFASRPLKKVMYWQLLSFLEISKYWYQPYLVLDHYIRLLWYWFRMICAMSVENRYRSRVPIFISQPYEYHSKITDKVHDPNLYCNPHERCLW